MVALISASNLFAKELRCQKREKDQAVRRQLSRSSGSRWCSFESKSATMIPTITIPKLHLEYRLWIAELNFSKEEITIFERHLEDMVAKNSDLVARTQVEHFQNQFIREKEVIDELKHKLNISERQLAGFVRELSGMGLESIKMDNHGNLREEMKTFRVIYGDLKEEFRRFEREYQ